MAKNFAITGVAGYIAPRHLKAIRETGNTLIAACDPHDSVGLLDSFSYEVSYFKEFERFDRHAEKLRRKSEAERIQYVSICSPNYLHDAHIRFALRIGAHAICEKPLVLNPWNLDALADLAQEYDRKIFTILQLRVHPALAKLRESILASNIDSVYDINLTYITSRGKWYLASWKGNPEQSGGLATNIGIHFFDVLIWIFGEVVTSQVHYADPARVSGYLVLKRARVKWFLSIDRNDLPDQAKAISKSTFRSITVNGQEIEFSEGFTDLHTTVYKTVLDGTAFGPKDAKPSVELAHAIRTAACVGITRDSHALLI